MSPSRNRREVLAVLAGVNLSLAGCTSSGDSPDGESNSDSNPDGESSDDTSAASAGESWQSVSIEDATTGESFTIEELDRPALVHTFAIWCSKCQRQHGQFQTLRESVGDEVAPVELNIDPNEDPDAIREHAESNGFDWRFGVSPDSVTQSLVDQYGARMASPPQSAVLLVCPDGEVHVLDDSTVVGADALEAAIENNC